jgi:hypothetical protein
MEVHSSLGNITTIITHYEFKRIMKKNLRNSMLCTSALLIGVSVSILAVGQVGIAFSQSGGNVTAHNPNATSMEANITGSANANNTNQSAPTAANTTAANASQSNASLSS